MLQSSVLLDDVVSDSISSMSISSSSSMVSESSYRTENSETRTVVSETHVTRKFESETSSVESLPLPYSPHRVSKPRASPEQESEEVQSPLANFPGPPLPPRRYKEERPVTQYLMDDPALENVEGTTAAVPDEASAMTEDQNGGMGNTSVDDTQEEVEDIAGAEGNGTTSEKIESADRLTTHQDAYWYMPGIPR